MDARVGCFVGPRLPRRYNRVDHEEYEKYLRKRP
jgi:hypothetical protein